MVLRYKVQKSSKMDTPKKNEIPTKDWLAVVRTKLANERTFLAYFRTSIVFLASGVSIMRIELFEDVKLLGFFLLIISPITMVVGIVRLLSVRKAIKKSYVDPGPFI